MPNQINRDKAKIKHLLSVQGENYPTEEDFLYELVAVLQEFDMLDKEFTSKDIGKNVTSRLTDSGTLTDSFILLKDKGFLDMFEAPRRNKFKLLHHPWE